MSSSFKVHSSRLTAQRGVWGPGCRARATFALVNAALALALTVQAQPTNRPGRPEFSAFRLINDRNIFDPNRRPSYTRTPRSESTRRRTEYVTLVGTMSYEEKGPLAFFDGTSSQYRKVLKPSETIAGYRVADIGPSFVKLAVGTNEFQLPVGMQLRRDNEGNWQVGEPAYSSYDQRPALSSSVRPSPPTLAAQPMGAPSLSNGEPPAVALDPNGQPMTFDPQADVAGDTNAPPPEAAAAGASGETDPVLLRMMQRRAQELNR